MNRLLATAARTCWQSSPPLPHPSSSCSSFSPLGVLAYRLPPFRTLPHRSSACVRACASSAFSSVVHHPPSLPPSLPSRPRFLRPRYLYGPSLPSSSPERSQLYCTLGWVIRGSRNEEREREREEETGDGSELHSCAGEEDYLFFNEEGKEEDGRGKREAHRRGSRGKNSHRQPYLTALNI